MNWLEDLFFFYLRKNISLVGTLFDIPHDIMLEPFKYENVSKQTYKRLILDYLTIFHPYLKKKTNTELQESLNAFKNIVNSQIEMEYTWSSFEDLFRYYIASQFNLYFTYHKHYLVFEKQDSEGLAKAQEELKKYIILHGSQMFKILKSVLERKYIETKLTAPLYNDNTVRFDLLTASGGNLTYDQLPEPIRVRMKNVLSHAENDFIRNLLESEQMLDLIKVGKTNLADDFREKVSAIIQTSLSDLQELEQADLARRLQDLFKPGTVKKECVERLANNLQCADIDGRLVLSQVAESLSGMRNLELNKVLNTIFESNLNDVELPHFDLTGKECIFALAMEAISSNSPQPRNISLNIYGKQFTG